ncbi:hypothetical protein AGMMS49975_25630 [Clostridia bacterium]|nr:hypothetical protein AGMMS49975_25630 [Clostridia bacterium]
MKEDKLTDNIEMDTIEHLGVPPIEQWIGDIDIPKPVGILIVFVIIFLIARVFEGKK